MAEEDDFLKSWTDELKTMQECMLQVNTDTEQDLAKFFAQRHAGLLLSDMIRQTFSSCFQNRTNLAINDDHFSNSATFRELLDRCFMPVQQAVIVLMRAPRAGIEQEFSQAVVRALPCGNQDDR